jgi:hypothetical protein
MSKPEEVPVASVQPRHTREVIETLGDAIYQREIEPRLRPEDLGKFVLIDVVTGDYELDGDELAAEGRLQARRPDAQVWMLRAGSRYARHMGPRKRAVRE